MLSCVKELFTRTLRGFCTGSAEGGRVQSPNVHVTGDHMDISCGSDLHLVWPDFFLELPTELDIPGGGPWPFCMLGFLFVWAFSKMGGLPCIVFPGQIQEANQLFMENTGGNAKESKRRQSAELRPIQLFSGQRSPLFLMAGQSCSWVAKYFRSPWNDIEDKRTAWNCATPPIEVCLHKKRTIPKKQQRASHQLVEWTVCNGVFRLEM